MSISQQILEEMEYLEAIATKMADASATLQPHEIEAIAGEALMKRWLEAVQALAKVQNKITQKLYDHK